MIAYIGVRRCESRPGRSAYCNRAPTAHRDSHRRAGVYAHDFQGNIHQEKYINEMYGVKEMGLLWWERQGKTNKGKRAGRTFEETKKVASRSNERSNEWHELKAAYIHTTYYICST
jgi:hypothetical protein